MGLTKSVQPYWRLAIATIPTMPIISWTHRAPDAGLATTDCDAGPMLILLHGGSTARLGMFCTAASQGGNGRRVDSSSGALSWQADPVHSISASQFPERARVGCGQPARREDGNLAGCDERPAGGGARAIDKLTPNDKLKARRSATALSFGPS